MYVLVLPIGMMLKDLMVNKQKLMKYAAVLTKNVV